MDYIVINGKSSMTVGGLMIQSLPPIVKPMVRTLVEEIDGRDGDIVTKLGYKSYNKTVSIGLHGNFDINDVIEYFDQDGVIVFSDEPDKYYYFSMVDQIDFEKLIRYKTADVVFHVQPFKYKLNEEEIDNEEPGSFQVTNNGNVYSRPTVTIYGTGQVELGLNGLSILTIDMGTAEYITLNGNTLNATYGGVYMNRNVQGNLDALRLNPGENTLAVSGNVTRVVVNNYSRWI